MAKDRDDDQPGLFGREPYRGEPPASNETTSRSAAEAIKPDRNRLRARVLRHLAISGGATCDEVCEALGMGGNTARPRIRELVLLGRIADSGLTRPTASGRRAIVWMVR